jgi:hypothetical protein
MKGILLALLLLAPSPAVAAQGTVLSAPPAKPSPRAEYLIYLHGRIIEEQGPRPTSPKYGIYGYREILRQLAARGFAVISEARPKGTDPGIWADKVVRQVQLLLAAGVPPERITVVGFSKGGGIAQLASTRLAHPKVNFVLLAACNSGGLADFKPDLRGRLLSMFDDPDEWATSCGPTFAAATGPLVHQEVVLHNGQGHGAFFRPGPWLDQVAEWIRRAR